MSCGAIRRCRPAQHPAGRAMGDDDATGRGDGINERLQPFRQLRIGAAARRPVRPVRGQPRRQGAGRSGLDLARVRPSHSPQLNSRSRSSKMQAPASSSRRGADDLQRLAGAAQRAAIERQNLAREFALQRQPHDLRLTPAAFGQRRIERALDAALRVPFGLAMPHQIDGRIHARQFGWAACLISTTLAAP